MKKIFQVVAITIIFLALILPFKIYADSCSIQGVKVVREAVRNGYQFTIETESGAGTCMLEANNVSLSAIASSDNSISCLATFFGNHDLQEGWELTDSKFNYTSQPESITKTPFISVHFSAEKGQINTLLLTEVTLDGDKCESNWKEAFGK